MGNRGELSGLRGGGDRVATAAVEAIDEGGCGDDWEIGRDLSPKGQAGGGRHPDHQDDSQRWAVGRDLSPKGQAGAAATRITKSIPNEGRPKPDRSECTDLVHG